MFQRCQMFALGGSTSNPPWADPHCVPGRQAHSIDAAAGDREQEQPALLLGVLGSGDVACRSRALLQSCLALLLLGKK